MYDIYTPLSNLDYKFNYTEGVKKAQEVLTIFGEEYSQKVKAAFDERWIDVEENVGKRSGAYSGGSYDTKAFMLLNWQGTLDDLLHWFMRWGILFTALLRGKSALCLWGLPNLLSRDCFNYQ